MQLMSDAYRVLNEQLHSERADYGAKGSRWANHVNQIIRNFNIKTVLDYGCGKGTLGQVISSSVKEVQNYDMCVPGFTKRPHSAQLVVCTDVLEHVEPECEDNVLYDIASLTERLVFFNISLRPALKTLPDGRNTHINIKSQNAWLKKILNYFAIMEFNLVYESDKLYSFIFLGERLQ